MTRKFLTCLAAAAMLPVFSNAGSAAAPCGTRAEIVKKLSEEFKESAAIRGRREPGRGG
jgi:hypothetical protein